MTDLNADEALLHTLQQEAFAYFFAEHQPRQRPAVALEPQHPLHSARPAPRRFSRWLAVAVMEHLHSPFKHPAGGVHDHELCEHAHPTNWRNPEPRSTYPLVVIGGGPVGCELAQALARLGSRVAIIHNQPLFLPKEERDAAQMVAHALARDGVEIHRNTNATKVWVEGNQKYVQTCNDGNVATIRVDEILTGIGRVPAVLGHAGEMINGITLAMVAGIGLKTVARVIHTYPTQADAIHMAARAHRGSGIHPWLARLLRPWLNR